MTDDPRGGDPGAPGTPDAGDDPERAVDVDAYEMTYDITYGHGDDEEGTDGHAEPAEAGDTAAGDGPAHGAGDGPAHGADDGEADPDAVGGDGTPRVPARRAPVDAEGVRRATVVMALGTTLSRLTGVLRIFALVYAVGFKNLADAYNLANTMPNIVHDLVLGGIVSATFIPVFVERLTTRSDDDAWEAISAVVSVTMIVIAAASVLFLVVSPVIIDATTVFNHAAGAGQERRVATDLLVLFVPQLTAYGFISLGTALLNARRRFGAPMFTPVANNVILVALLVVFGATVHHASLAGVDQHRGQLLLLGLGTTAGVIVQAVLMVPSLRRAGLRLRWNPDFRHEAVRTILRLSGWTFGLVVANQLALVVVLAMSERVGPGAVSAYTYAYTFFQLPYGVVAVSIMSATAPELTARWATGDLVAFRRRMGTGLRAMLAVVIPAAAGELVLAHPLVEFVGHWSTTAAGTTEPTAVALAMLALGLPGFCVFLYTVRVLQSVQDLRSAFWLYVIENAVNIILAVVLAGPLGVRGIALSISIAYTVGAVVGLVWVRERVEGLGGELVGRPLGHVLWATAALVVAATLASNLTASASALALLSRLVLGTAAGAAAYVLAAGALAELAARRATGGPTTGPAGPRHRAGRRRRRARGGPPPRPAALPPAGRPPRRPINLGPTRKPGSED